MAWKEPHIGYTEGIHGINGWCLASGRGVLRSMCCRESLPCNLVPSDIVVNGIIVLAYECGKRNQNRYVRVCILNFAPNSQYSATTLSSIITLESIESIEDEKIK